MCDAIPPNKVLPLFIEILNGVEAAHLQGVVHRDLKPENILYDAAADYPLIADFGMPDSLRIEVAPQFRTVR